MPKYLNMLKSLLTSVASNYTKNKDNLVKFEFCCNCHLEFKIFVFIKHGLITTNLFWNSSFEQGFQTLNREPTQNNQIPSISNLISTFLLYLYCPVGKPVMRLMWDNVEGVGADEQRESAYRQSRSSCNSLVVQ